MNSSAPRRLDPPQPVLVVGATGTVGGAVVSALVARGAPVRALVRRARDDLASVGVEQVIGDLADPRAVAAAAVGVRSAFYVSPHADDELDLAKTFVGACSRAGVRIVFAGVHVSSTTIRSRIVLHTMRVMFPAYRPKLAVGQLLERAAPSSVIFVPTNFFDNDELFLPEILAGTYPAPMRGINRVAASDIGAACALALLDPAFPAGTFPVCGPQTLSGEQSAAIWGQVLGREVRYTGADAETWRRVSALRLPAGKKGRDYRASFKVLGRLALHTPPADVARTAQLLGRPPIDLAEYARDLLERDRVRRTEPSSASTAGKDL